jgi:hypothetical protein
LTVNMHVTQKGMVSHSKLAVTGLTAMSISEFEQSRDTIFRKRAVDHSHEVLPVICRLRESDNRCQVLPQFGAADILS